MLEFSKFISFKFDILFLSEMFPLVLLFMLY